jgi:uracil-DNA glycosylase
MQELKKIFFTQKSHLHCEKLNLITYFIELNMNLPEIDINPLIDSSWKKILADEFASPYFNKLKSYLVEEKSKYTVYPPGNLIFSAFNLTPFNSIKVVIIGQDPYHGPKQANGLSFSVSTKVPNPPSLKNIFKELQNDLGVPIPNTGNLESWARQGVLLLNSVLTVRANTPGSHKKKGWETFTDAVIKSISEQKKGIVFLLWGNAAQSKEQLINLNKHYVLKAAHPSPLARGAFFGCRHFSKTNKILIHEGLQPIDWNIN